MLIFGLKKFFVPLCQTRSLNQKKKIKIFRETFLSKKKSSLLAQRALKRKENNYRLENWKRLRAPLRPYFLRSFLRGSRVRYPSSLRSARIASSSCTSARLIPRRVATA